MRERDAIKKIAETPAKKPEKKIESKGPKTKPHLTPLS